MTLREIVGTHKELAHKVAALDQKYQHHDAPPKRRIGFRAETD